MLKTPVIIYVIERGLSFHVAQRDLSLKFFYVVGQTFKLDRKMKAGGTSVIDIYFKKYWDFDEICLFVDLLIF